MKRLLILLTLSGAATAADAPSVEVVDYECLAGHLSTMTLLIEPLPARQLVKLEIPMSICVEVR